MVVPFFDAPFSFKQCLAIMIVLALCITNTVASELSDIKWQKRPLLIFAPDKEDQRLHQIRDNLRGKRCELEDRDIMIAVITQNGASKLGDSPLTSEYVKQIRRRYAIAGDQFAVVLIGKDGGEKYRSYNLPDLDEVFVLIDGMPMRQSEMARNAPACR